MPATATTMEPNYQNHVDRKKEALGRLKDAVTSLTTSEGFQTWLRLRSKTSIGRYSLCNQLLLADQDPDITRVAGYQAWLKEDRQVMKGQKALWILAPVKRDFEELNERTGDTKRVTRLVGYQPAAVFDIKQTHGPDLPQYTISPTGDSAASKEGLLLDYAQNRGLQVISDNTGKAAGYYDPSTKQIVLSRELDENGRVHTLLHELVHHLGIGYEGRGRQAAELITETAAVIVGASLGLDSVESSSFYLAAWANGDKAEVFKHLQAADDIARKLEQALAIQCR